MSSNQAFPKTAFLSLNWYYDGYLCGLLDIDISKHKLPDVERNERSDWRLGLHDGRKFRISHDKNGILLHLRSLNTFGYITISRSVEDDNPQLTDRINDGSELFRDRPTWDRNT